MAACKLTSECLEQCAADAAEKIRQAPLQSVLIAGTAGFVLRFIPVFAILGFLLRTALVLLKPALVVFGIYKLTQCCRSQGGSPLRSQEVSDQEFPRPVTPP